jgi:hypothetical protein
MLEKGVFDGVLVKSILHLMQVRQCDDSSSDWIFGANLPH